MTMLDPSKYKSTIKTPERQDMGKIANFLSNMASIEWFTLQRLADVPPGSWVESSKYDALWFSNLVTKRLAVKAPDSNIYQITPAAQRLVGAFHYFLKRW